MKITCVSDLHGFYPKTSGGDLLIVAGDLTDNHTFGEFAFDFISWLDRQDYRKKVVVAGNHDTFLETEAVKLLDGFCDYLCDSGTEFDGLKIHGSPWTKTFLRMNPKCKAFTCETEEELSKKWEIIPNDTDIVITHSPLMGILDKVYCHLDMENGMYLDSYISVGSPSLHDRVVKILPLLHCSGHIHEGYGYRKLGNTTFVNASHVNEHYKPVNAPIDIEL